MWVTSSLATVRTPTVIALGNFDGIHRGHQQVIGALPVSQLASLSAARLEVECGLASKPESGQRRGIKTVVTFDPHPQEFFSGQTRTLLTPLTEKQSYLQSLGAEQLVLLPFNQDLACLSPQAFVEKILIEQLQAQQISVGFNFRFGHRRAGTAADLKAIAATFGVPVQVVSPQADHGEQISSSAIRQALLRGNVERANCLLGRSYSLVGEVLPGQQLGRTLGFPTANLDLPSEKFLPKLGVYSVFVQGGSLEQPQAGVLNLGYRPTVEGKQLLAEVHLLDWSGSLYGQTLIVELKKFLRPEQRFADLQALQTQIEADCRASRAFLGLSGSV